MHRYLAVTLLYFPAFLNCLLGGEPAGGIKNPLKDAQAGDWVEIQFTYGKGEGSHIVTQKSTVVARDDKTVTLEHKGRDGAKEIDPTKEVVKLEATWQRPMFPPEEVAHSQLLAEGDETLTLHGKEYKCHWRKVKIENRKGVSTMTAWFSTDVPLDGLAKAIGDSGNPKTSIEVELIGCGRGK